MLKGPTFGSKSPEHVLHDIISLEPYVLQAHEVTEKVLPMHWGVYQAVYRVPTEAVEQALAKAHRLSDVHVDGFAGLYSEAVAHSQKERAHYVVVQSYSPEDSDTFRTNHIRRAKKPLYIENISYTGTQELYQASRKHAETVLGKCVRALGILNVREVQLSVRVGRHISVTPSFFRFITFPMITESTIVSQFHMSAGKGLIYGTSPVGGLYMCTLSKNPCPVEIHGLSDRASDSVAHLGGVMHDLTNENTKQLKEWGVKEITQLVPHAMCGMKNIS